MPGTPGPRTGLPPINPTGEAPTILRSTINAVISWLEGNAMLTSSGLLSARPVSTPGSPGISGRRYYATDTGVEYRDTGTGWIALGVELVTSLPASPYEGQIVHYLANATSGLVWPLRYRAASASALKWEAAGSPSPLHSYISSEQGSVTTAGSWVNLATDGPSIVVPLAGDYDIEFGARLKIRNRNDVVQVGVAVGNTTPNDPLLILQAEDANNTSWVSGTRMAYEQATLRLTGLTAGATLKLRYNASVSDVNLSFRDRLLRVTPVRVG